MRQPDISDDSADSTSRWPVFGAFVVGVLLVATATRDVSQPTRTVAADEDARTAAFARVVQLSAVLVAATDAETCSHGYVITGDAGFLAPFERALYVEAEEMAMLEALYIGDPERGPLLAPVREALATQRVHMSRAVALRRALGAGEAAPLIAGFRGRELTDSLRVALKVIVTDEQSALSRQRAQTKAATLVGTRRLLISAGIALVLLALGLGAIVGRRSRANALLAEPIGHAFEGPVAAG